MNILLIHPKMNHGPITIDERGTLKQKFFSNPELTLPAVAASIPKKHNIKIIHENYEDIDYSDTYDLVGISCFTMFAPQVYEIADKFRKIGVPVILGGYHPSALPKEAKQHADSIVIGEAEKSFPRLINDLEKKKLKPFYQSRSLVQPEDIPPLRRDLLNFNPLSSGLRATRGCPYNCEFCSITYFYKHTFRKRPIKNVIDEIKSIPCKNILIHDANLTADPKYSKELFKTMITEKVNKKWLGNGNIHILGQDEEFLELARKSGCICWTVGLESIYQESLNGVKKFSNNVEMYSNWIKNIRKHGMIVNGLFIFGFDQDTIEIFDKTLKALDNLRIDCGEFNILTPLPGTPLHNKLDKEGRILTKKWSQYTQTQVVFQPKNMTPEELYEGTKKIVKEFHRPSKIFLRASRLVKMSFNHSALFLMLILNQSHRLWYKRDFNI